MDLFIERFIAAFIILLGPCLAVLDMPGNTIVLLTAIGFGLYSEVYWQPELFFLMFTIYVIGELWEFFIGFFGIRKEKASWFACLVIGLGGFCGAVIGTAVMPIIGSIAGGVLGAFITAFIYEYIRGESNVDALKLAWVSAKMRFLAVLGKFCAGIALGVCLFKIVFLY